MAEPYWKNDRWYLRYKDPSGKWRDKASNARTKTEARRLQAELEREIERQRMGLAPIPPADGGGTLGALLDWWLADVSKGSPSHSRNESAIRAHLSESPLAPLLLVHVATPAIEAFLKSKEPDLGPQSINHLRGFLVRAFNAARRFGKWAGGNPASAAKKRKVPRRKPGYLRWEEVPAVLAALSPRWRALFATAIYTGMRKGELLGLRKDAIDWSAGVIMVRRSHDRDATKNDREEAIPIAPELVPYLTAAIASSTCGLVFPGADDKPMRADVKLVGVLRRALARAGIVLGYEHVCRRKGCTHVEHATDADVRRCPVHGAKLWPKAKVRPIRFHDTRHSTASLLMMAGASPAAVQKIMRHSDPRITTEVYGHFAPEYLRSEIGLLAFGAAPLAAGLLPESGTRSDKGQDSGEDPAEPGGISMARHTRFERVTFGSGGRRSIQLS